MTEMPYHAIQVRQAPPRSYERAMFRHRGRFGGCLIVGFVGILASILLCIASIALYILIPQQAVNILIMGLDSRAGEGYYTRSDVIMLVGVQPSRLDVSLLSIPRDLFFDVPIYGLQRINTVNVLGESEREGGGVDLLQRTLQNSLDIELDYYARLDFRAFIDVVNAIGGIEIDVPYEIHDYAYPTPDFGTIEVHFDAGRQHMDGETALIYARTRHTDDDYRRAERQQQVVQALMTKLINPFTWVPAWVALSQSVDTNLNPLVALQILPPVLLGGGFDQLVINRDYIRGGDGYVVPNLDLIRPWVAERFN